MKTHLKLLLLAGSLFFTLLLHARPLAQADVPQPLKPWVNWVLYAQEQANCPHAYRSQQRFCAWPSALKLELNDTQGRFSQRWQVQTETWVRLPGNAQQWPHDVEVDSIAAVVINRHGFPAVKLEPGEHEISGGFQWESIPEALTIPPATGLIQISRNGLVIDSPRINQQGQLWLDKSPAIQDIQDALDIQVYRKINDTHPMQVQTRLVLHVAGRSRDILLPRLQLQQFTPLRLNSSLPARINQQGDLQVQVRPGNWIIDLFSYHAGLVSELTLPEPHAPLPEQEVWVFQADPSLRLTEISGVPSVDSRQTRLPKEWRRYPAYLLTGKQTLKLKTLQRGGASPEPNRLRLQRAMWMDFDGKGYTFQDRLTGTMTRGWRLVSSPELQLGAVSIEGEPQFITTLEGGQDQGVEVRRGQIQVEATSRYSASLSQLPVSGWKHDFQAVDTYLYLAPGWKLFSAQGADNLPHTWLQSWTLLDLFLVLIIAVAIARLWDWKWGLFALLTMTLIWQEPGAPRYIWLNLIAAIALLRVLPKGTLKTLLKWYRNATLLALLLIVIPFVVSEVRHGLYPQLDLYADYDSSVPGAPPEGRILSYDSPMMEAAAPVVMDKRIRMAPESDKDGSRESLLQQKSRVFSSSSAVTQKQTQPATQMVDPNATIQTGPGLPTWHWQQVYFSWDSPVSETQTLQLRLLSPGVNMLLNGLRVVLLLVLIGRLLRVVSSTTGSGKPQKPSHRFSRQKALLLTSAGILLFSVVLSLTSPDVRAEVPPVASQKTGTSPSGHTGFPDQQLLQTLQQRLLAQDECLPECAQIEAMRLELSGQQLTLYLKIHSAGNIAVPLPGGSEQWRPEQVLLENRPATALSRDKAGLLWIGLPAGIQNVIMRGRLPRQPRLQLSLPLLPHYAEWQGEGWAVEGIRENNRPESQLQLIRKQSLSGSEDREESLAENNYLPPLLHIQRTLHLGLDWLVDTRVTRLSPAGDPVSMKIPLLENESVLSNTYTVKEGHVLINMSSTQQAVTWQSQLPVDSTLMLEATREPGLVESWKLDVSPVWHVAIEGIPGIHHSRQRDVWLPEWKPWPGEKIQLTVSRPRGIDGRTLTVERSVVQTRVGKRLRESELVLQLRSSRGGQHTITLPERATLVSVSINDKLQPVRQQRRAVNLPIIPGKQRIVVKWRVEQPVTTGLRVLPVNIGVESVNHSLYLMLGKDRWILFTHGPTMGPAVLFWGVLLVILIGSVLLGRIKHSPLRTWQWFLLGAGLSLATPLMIIVVVSWLLALNYRPRLQEVSSRFVFNAVQVLLVLLTLVALGSLVVALQQGLLGWPDMQIAGNGSTAWRLHWYQDRVAADLPQPWVISVPLLVYRVLMLLWALWLAFSLISWLRTGWQHFSVGGLWRPEEKKPVVNHAEKVTVQKE